LGRDLSSSEDELQDQSVDRPSSGFDIAYLDTQVALWLAQRDFGRISPKAKGQIASAMLLISPLVVVEMEFLFEIGRILLPAEEVRLVLHSEHGVTLCDLDLTDIMKSALSEKWTRDPFDRLIVAHAKAKGFCPLISADRKIGEHYPRTVW
jgi:PIN domain nuclease of toxin-antitoxin system